MVSCSSGTYVRALARDLGQSLGCGAHLTALRRTGVDPFVVDEAHTLATLSERTQADAASPHPKGLATIPLEEVARRCFEQLALTEEEARALRYGQPLDAAVLERTEAPEGQSGTVASKGPRGGASWPDSPPTDGSWHCWGIKARARVRFWSSTRPENESGHEPPARPV